MGSSQRPLGSKLQGAGSASQFGEHTPLSEKLLAIAIRAQNFTGSTGIAIALTEGDEMVCRANWGTSAPEVGTKLSIEHSFTGLCVRTGEPVRCDDAENDPRVNPDACRALGISAIAAAPIRRGLKVIGVIAAFSDTPRAFTEKHLLILGTLADVVVELLDDPHPVQPLPKSEDAFAAEAPKTEVLPESEQVTLLSVPAGSPEKKEETAPVSVAAPPFEPIQEKPEPVAAAPPPAAEPMRREGWVKAAVPPAPATPAVAPPARPAGIRLSSALGFDRGEHSEPASHRFDRRKPDQPKEERPQVLPAAADVGPQKVSSAPTLTLGLASSRSMPEHETAEATPRFVGLGLEALTCRRWLIPAAVFALFAVLAAVGWRLHVAHSAASAKATAASNAAESASEPASSSSQSDAAADFNPGTKADAQPSPFSPPPMAAMVPARAGATSTPRSESPVRGAARVSEAPPDVTVRHVPQPVIETAGPVRQPKSSGMEGQNAEAPKLALSSPAMLPNLAAPVASVAGPTSHVAPARLLQRVEPVYPDLARRMLLSGKVVVSVTVAKDGSVSDVRWVSGNEVFRASSTTAVRQWRYRPANLDGQPVTSQIQVVLQYNPPRR